MTPPTRARTVTTVDKVSRSHGHGHGGAIMKRGMQRAHILRPDSTPLQPECAPKGWVFGAPYHDGRNWVLPLSRPSTVVGQALLGLRRERAQR